MFRCVIVINKSMFCTLSSTFRLRFGFVVKRDAPKNRELRTYCPLDVFTLFCTKT